MLGAWFCCCCDELLSVSLCPSLPAAPSGLLPPRDSESRLAKKSSARSILFFLLLGSEGNRPPPPMPPVEVFAFELRNAKRESVPEALPDEGPGWFDMVGVAVVVACARLKELFAMLEGIGAKSGA